MKVTLIVVSWNTQVILKECLSLIDAAAGDLEYEVLVVDNGSKDGSQQMVSSLFPYMKLINNSENVGFAKAVNQGIQASDSEYVVLLNSDILAGEKSLERLVDYMESNKKLALVAPQLITRNGKLEDSQGYEPSPLSVLKQTSHKLSQRFRSMFKLQKATNQKGLPSDWLGASYMVIRRKAIDEVGMFDEGIFMYGEDMEFCLRCSDRGWGIEFVPWVTSIHYGGGSSNEINEAKMLAVVGTYRIAAERLPRFSYMLFGIMWTAVLAMTSFQAMILLNYPNRGENKKYNTGAKKLLSTTFKLSIRPRQYANQYFSELENNFRRKLDAKSMKNFHDRA
jgi:GT2 family glycosyltransferase